MLLDCCADRANVANDWRCIVLLACFVLSVHTHNAQGRSPDQELADTLLAGLRNHVERLKSGVVDIEVHDQNGTVVEKFFVAFDDGMEKVRCDVEVARDGREVRIIRTNENFLQFINREDGGLLSRLNPGEQSNVLDGMPIDVRAIGLLEHRGVKLGGMAEDVLKTLEQATLVDANVEDDIGVVVVESGDEGKVHMACWIDINNGYVPARRQTHMVVPVMGSVLAQEVETSWAETNGVWVAVESVTRFMRGKGNIKSVEEVHLDWKSVNEEVPQELFTEENLSLPDNTYIVDARLGTPLLEKVIGLDRPLPSAPIPQGNVATRIVMVGIGAILLLIIVLFLRRRKRLHNPR